MARTVKEEEHTLKRNEILDAAQRIIYARGYEQMSIQDILDALNISKGAFYHYFPSKQALLAAIIDRMLEEAKQIILPIVDDPQLSALEKLHGYFSTVARWKTARKDFLLALLRVWYADENLVVRHKFESAALEWVTPLFARIITQGVAEGVFSTPHPQQVGGVVVALMYRLGDVMAAPLLSGAPGEEVFRQLMEAAAVYTDSIERVLGAVSGSLSLFDAAVLRAWCFQDALPQSEAKDH
ncbi:MAG: TetR/AcrR family transcriptional regulator [Anaerolineae bacterium]|nr:TetR/AcrR family transcriptional regulator [Anaerolineae bacterium]